MSEQKLAINRVSRQLGLHTYNHGFILVFGKIVWIPVFPRIRNAALFIRGLFPMAYSYRHFCCDTGWYGGGYGLAFNEWHLSRIERELDQSDGTVVTRLSIPGYFRYLAAKARGEL